MQQSTSNPNPGPMQTILGGVNDSVSVLLDLYARQQQIETERDMARAQIETNQLLNSSRLDTENVNATPLTTQQISALLNANSAVGIPNKYMLLAALGLVVYLAVK